MYSLNPCNFIVNSVLKRMVATPRDRGRMGPRFSDYVVQNA